MSRKRLSWVATIAYPGMQPIEFGTVETVGFDPAYVRQEFNTFIRQHLPDGFELRGFRRGRLIFQEDSTP
jgi:hypothetical protein